MQMNETEEDLETIRILQENLRKALGRWDATEEESRDFGGLVPVVDELEDALGGLQRRRSRASAARLCRLGGRAALAAALVFLLLAAFGGWNTVLLVLTVVAVTSGAVLLVVGGRRA
ncbi:hypothetical protein OHS18_38355 [Amycolatopsis sp. NBC_00355]|uniref:hypothetical protein n=1 Tax=Amycolatopsis sp. NBC_00355 TaxID=2975957 RepID=UPI002E25F5DD